MKLRINVVDAFSSEIFKGNPAAVIITADWMSSSLMQSIATENNLSETAFLVAKSSGDYDIRWFSPLTEIDFCGHATLASAAVIFAQNQHLSTINIHAPVVGNMRLSKLNDGWMQMDFPNRMPKPLIDVPEPLISGLSIQPDQVLINEQAYFAIYPDQKAVQEVEQQAELLKQLAPLDVVVTAKGENYDFVSRYFWPANGGDEDPVTGSIHTGLAPYWAEQLGKTELMAYQASARGGVLRCSVRKERVFISGQAVHYLEGVINV